MYKHKTTDNTFFSFILYSEMYQSFFQNCLSRWKEEVTKDILCLQTSIKEIDHKIESMYEEDDLKRLEYQLHAVMVHEGGVDSGHYWAYVKDHKKQVIYPFYSIFISLLLLKGTRLPFKSKLHQAYPLLFPRYG